MEKQFKKKITWVLKNFPSLQSEKLYSDNFLVGGCKWNILAYHKGNNVAEHLFLFLEVATFGSLPTGWRRHAKTCFVLVNQHSENLSQRNELEHWFDPKAPRCNSMFPLSEIHAKDTGFLVNGEHRIVAEIDVLEVIGKLDVSEETSTIVETMEVHGFQLLPSQAKVVSRMFERHPQIASDFRPKDPILKTCYMSLLLGLIEIMCKLPQEMSKDDLSDAYVALGSLRDAGFKLDWLEKKLDEMSKKQENLEANETVLQKMEEELKDLKQKSSILEAEMQAIETLVSIAKAPFSFDDVV